MPIISVNNINCYYEIHGSGKPLVLIAGLASDAQSWQPVLSLLAKHFKVVIFDNRGIGRTEYPRENFQISTLAADTFCLLDKLRIDKADILGHSMGGCIAQEMAIEYPQRVGRLILANTRAAPSPETKSVFGALLKILDNGDYELFIREFFKLIFTPGYLGRQEIIEPAIKAAVNYAYPVTADGFRLQLEAINNFNSLDRLNRIRAETLVIAGKKDMLITVEEPKLLADKIPSAKLFYMESLAHSFAEQPGTFINCMLQFLLEENK